MGNLLGMYVSAIIGIFCFIFSFHIAVIISTFLIAKNKNRNSWNWAALALFWGLGALLIVFFSRPLNYDEDLDLTESDTLSKVLWGVVFIPWLVFILLCANYSRIVSSESKTNSQTSITNSDSVRNEEGSNDEIGNNSNDTYSTSSNDYSDPNATGN